MISILILFWAVISADPLLPSKIATDWKTSWPRYEAQFQANEIKSFLRREGQTLSEAVIDKVATSLHCANQYQVSRNQILTVIDYSLPSNKKRLWVFNLDQKKLLFHTYVSHGIKSGALLTNRFSNQYNSKASSLGVYKTEQSYYGREGLSLRLNGLDRSFNSNASNRYIVMHGGWYMEEPFIKRYGRPGRSWGCPALPLTYYQPIINTIKENSLLVVYYPDQNWLNQSKFLNCSKTQALAAETPQEEKAKETPREDILFADLNHNNRKEENDPVVTLSADHYERVFHRQAPLERMLRRQINHMEYIVLSSRELDTLIQQNNQEAIQAITFIVPNIIMVRGYYETQMKKVPLGKIKTLKISAESLGNRASPKQFTLYFETRPNIELRSNTEFIRWVGL